MAVKQLKQSGFASDSDVEDFFAEAQLLRNLHHPSIVQFKGAAIQVGKKKHCLAVVEEFMDAGTLTDYIVRQMRNEGAEIYSPRQGILWMLQVAQALEYLHGLKVTVIHRDLKPENILLTYGKGIQAKIVDFGLSALVTKPGSIISDVPDCTADSDGVYANLQRMASKHRWTSNGRQDSEEKPSLPGNKIVRLGSNLMRSLTFVEKVFSSSKHKGKRGGDQHMPLVNESIFDSPVTGGGHLKEVRLHLVVFSLQHSIVVINKRSPCIKRHIHCIMYIEDLNIAHRCHILCLRLVSSRHPGTLCTASPCIF